MNMLQLRDLTKEYGAGTERHMAVNNVNLSIKKGEFVVLIGPSGCGKTTTLKMINNLVKPTSGDIFFNGKSTKQINVVDLRRGIGYVIQNIGLFPHLTIAANVEIVPKLKKVPKEQRRKRTFELLEMVGLDPEVYADRYPAELSGGQQQRIGVLRALAADAELILMDEPFGALDPITRDQLQEEMKDLQQRLHKTIVFVTHDMDEALKLADKIVLMKDGEVVQAASPQEMLKNPANDFVREFIGEDRLAPQPDMTPVSDVMTAKPLVISIDSSPREVFREMQKTRTDVAVVTGADGKVIGLITADRVMKKKRSNGSLNSLMDESVSTVRGGTTIRDAAQTLASKTRILCVVNRRHRPIGLVSRATLLEGLVELWDECNSVKGENNVSKVLTTTS